MVGEDPPAHTPRSRGRPAVPNSLRRTFVFDGAVYAKLKAEYGQKMCDVIRAVLAEHARGLVPDSVVESSTTTSAKAIAARENFDDFVEYVRTDEYTGTPVVQCDERKAWTDIRHHQSRAVITSNLLGKTIQFAVLYPLWLLGRDPSCRVSVVGRTRRAAQSSIRECARLMASDAAIREVFPDLQGVEDTDYSVTIRRPFGVVGSSLTAFGVKDGYSNQTLGDVVIFDDIVPTAEARSRRAMADLRDRVSTYLPKLGVTRGRTRSSAYVVGAKKWGGDLYDMLAANGWPAYNFGGDPPRIS